MRIKGVVKDRNEMPSDDMIMMCRIIFESMVE